MGLRLRSFTLFCLITVYFGLAEAQNCHDLLGPQLSIRSEILYRLGLHEALFNRYENNTGVLRLSEDLLRGRTEQSDYGWIHVGSSFTETQERAHIKVNSLLAQNMYIVAPNNNSSASMAKFMVALGLAVENQLLSGRSVVVSFESISNEELLLSFQSRFANSPVTRYSENFGIGHYDMEFRARPHEGID